MMEMNAMKKKYYSVKSILGGSDFYDENGNYVSGIGTDADGYYYGEIVRWNPNEYKYEECGEKLDHVDMINDLVDVPGKVGDMVDLVSKFKVYPNASVTFSYRLF